MPRRKRPHRHEITYLKVDERAPYTQRRAIYTRLSDDDRDSISHAQQETVAAQYAKTHGYFVAAIYRDWRSGFDAARLGLQQLIDDAIAGLHNGVIFYDHTRIHRGETGLTPIVYLHTALPRYAFESATEPYDVKSAHEFAAIGKAEVELTRRRSTESRRQRAAAGQFVVGNKPYWLERDPNTREVILVDDRARVVLEAVKQYASGVQMSRIARWMTENAPVRDGRVRWSSSRVRQVFRNPALWGDLAYSRYLVITESRDGDEFVIGRGVNPDSIPFRVPALIHQSEIERAACEQSGGCARDDYPAGDTLDALIRANNPRASGKPYTLQHPLRRRVVCPCGWRMGFRLKRYNGIDKDYGYLFCTRTKQRGKSVVADYPPCPISGISTRKLWPKVREILLERIETPDRAELTLETWSKLLDRYVSDVVLDAHGEPSIRWRRPPIGES